MAFDFSFFYTIKGIILAILFFGGSIFVHELGHFLFAKWRGLKVDRFSIGFGPKVIGWQGKDGVDYRISLIPLGGYVSIPQLAEMEMIEGKSSQKNISKKISFFDKILVFAAGAFFNVLFAIALIFVLWGIKSTSSLGVESNQIGYIEEKILLSPDDERISPAFKAGLKAGDKIIAVDGIETSSYSQIIQAIALGTGRSSDGKPQTILSVQKYSANTSSSPQIEKIALEPLLVSQNPRTGDFIRMIGILPISNLHIVPASNSPAEKAGLKTGDKLVACKLKNGEKEIPIFSIIQFNDIMRENQISPIEMIVLRKVDNKEIRKSIIVHPIAIPDKSAYCQITFTEGTTPRKIKLIMTPKNLNDYLGERTQISISNLLPEDSELSQICVPGVTLQGFSKNNNGIITAKDIESFNKNFTSDEKCNLTLFFSDNGVPIKASLNNAQVEYSPTSYRPVIGFNLQEQKILVRHSPWEQLKSVILLTVDSIVSLISPKSDIGINHLNSVFSISETYVAISSDIRQVLYLTIILNINLAILNLLPIPVLDGGHILISCIQRFFKGPITQKIINAIQYAFFFVLFGFMGFILFKDFIRFQGNRDLSSFQLVQQFERAKPTEIELNLEKENPSSQK